MVNDMTILGGFIILFVAIGIAIPVIESEYSSSTTEYDLTTVSGDQDSSDLTGLSAWKVIKSIALMFVWSFSGIPLWIELLIFEPIRIIAYAILARNIWPGGGS